MKQKPKQKRRPHISQNYAKPAAQLKHDLGQHFLYDTALLHSLVESAGVTQADHVLEIGAGAGTMTRILCEAAGHVTAVEIDDVLLPGLTELSEECKNLTVIQSDIRKVDLEEISGRQAFCVVANIPYSITSQIFDLFWGKGYPIRQMSVMVQKEVADKLTATPGDKAYGLLSVRCHYYCIPEIAVRVPSSAFTPPPKVDSAFVNLAFRSAPPAPVLDERLLWRLVKASYRLRRKTLLNAMKTVVAVPADILREILSERELPQTIRGEALSVEEWIALSNAVHTRSCPSPPSENC